MATLFVLPLDQVCTSLSALVPRFFFVPAKSSKLDDAFSKAAFIFYTALEFCVLFFKRVYDVIFSLGGNAPFSLGGTNFIELFNIPRYISLKLLSYRQVYACS